MVRLVEHEADLVCQVQGRGRQVMLPLDESEPAQGVAERGIDQEQRPGGRDLEHLRDGVAVLRTVRERGPVTVDRPRIARPDRRVAPVIVAAVIPRMGPPDDAFALGAVERPETLPHRVGRVHGTAQEDGVLGPLVERQEEIGRGRVGRPDDLLQTADLRIQLVEPIGIGTDDHITDEVGQELAPSSRLVDPMQIVGQDHLLAFQGLDLARVPVDQAVPLPEENDLRGLIEATADQVPPGPRVAPQLLELHLPPAISVDQPSDDVRELAADVVVEAP